MKPLIYISIIILLLAGCRTRKHTTATTYTDSVSVIETLKPRIITIPGDSLYTAFRLSIQNGRIVPHNVSLQGQHSNLVIDVDSAGKVTATATTPERTETVYVPERTENRSTNRSSEIEKIVSTNNYPRWLVIPAMIGVAAIAYLLFTLYKRIRRKFPP